MMLRLFFAVDLPEETKNAVAQIQSGLREAAGERGIRWTTTPQFHYTLKFLGETPEEQLPLVIHAGDLAASSVSPFSLTLAKVGAFPRQRSPQVLWIGASEGVPVLTRLAECLDEHLSERGFAPEKRRFNAHLTLARAKSPEGEESLARILGNLPESVDKFSSFPVESFVLMRSELRPAGSVYTVLKTFALRNRV
jgi:RNA 2',3'-cyclic 3'-phosphodiesterase